MHAAMRETLPVTYTHPHTRGLLLLLFACARVIGRPNRPPLTNRARGLSFVCMYIAGDLFADFEGFCWIENRVKFPLYISRIEV